MIINSQNPIMILYNQIQRIDYNIINQILKYDNLKDILNRDEKF